MEITRSNSPSYFSRSLLALGLYVGIHLPLFASDSDYSLSSPVAALGRSAEDAPEFIEISLESLLYTTSANSEQIWDPETQGELHEIPTANGLSPRQSFFDYSSSRDKVVIGIFQNIRGVSISNQEPLFSLSAFNSYTSQIDFISEDKVVAIGDGDTVVVIDLTSGEIAWSKDLLNGGSSKALVPSQSRYLFILDRPAFQFGGSLSESRLTPGFNADNVRSISILNKDTGEEAIQAFGSSSKLTSFVFSPNERYLAAITEDGEIRIMDVLTGEEKSEQLPANIKFPRLSLSNDGKTIALRGLLDDSPYFVVLDSEKGTPPVDFNAIRVNANYLTLPIEVFVSADGSKAWMAEFPDQLTNWDLSNGTILETPELNGITYADIAFSSDSTRLAIATTDGKLIVENDATSSSRTIQFPDSLKQVEFSPDGQKLFCLDNLGNVFVLDPTTANVVSNLPFNPQAISWIAESPESGKWLVSDVSGTVDSVDFSTWEAASNDGLTNPVEFTYDAAPEEHLILGFANRKISLFDAAAGTKLVTLDYTLETSKGADDFWGTISPDRSRVLILSSSPGRFGFPFVTFYTAKVFDRLSGQEIFSIGHLLTATFSFSGDTLCAVRESSASTEPRTLLLYDVDTGVLTKIIDRPTVSFSEFVSIAYTAYEDSFLALTDTHLFRYSKKGDILQAIRSNLSSQNSTYSSLRPELVAFGDSTGKVQLVDLKSEAISRSYANQSNPQGQAGVSSSDLFFSNESGHLVHLLGSGLVNIFKPTKTVPITSSIELESQHFNINFEGSPNREPVLKTSENLVDWETSTNRTPIQTFLNNMRFEETPTTTGRIFYEVFERVPIEEESP